MKMAKRPEKSFHKRQNSSSQKEYKDAIIINHQRNAKTVGYTTPIRLTLKYSWYKTANSWQGCWKMATLTHCGSSHQSVQSSYRTSLARVLAISFLGMYPIEMGDCIYQRRGQRAYMYSHELET